ncbi:putative membrane protein YdfK [bioreactor metagenome]|uniref:Putative membrane protein YdfK n=1 Tax=bioreactor metagenome TaxID=1076179 RepID=A0A644XHZ1_9ZZZZ
MVLLGSMVNSAAIILGGSIGLALKKGLSDRIASAVMNALALCVLYIGVSGMLKGENILITILSMVFGTLVGEWIDLDKKINQLGDEIESRVSSENKEHSVSNGFVTASLLFCVGAMAIVGALQSGLTGNHDTLFAKSLIDGIAAIVMASSLGIGVLLSAGLILVYEGGITLFANVLAPLLTDSVINEMTCVGSLLIVGLALNMLKLTNLKIMNYAPAVFFPILFGYFM